MNFEEEHYVRVYTRNTPGWVRMPWQSRAVLPLIMRELNRKSGTLELGEDGIPGLADLIMMPPEVVEVGLRELLRRRTLMLEGSLLAMPNYLRAQGWVASDAQRMRNYRERKRQTAVPCEPVTDGDAALRSVTERYDESRAVTPSLPYPSLTDLNPLPLSGDPPVGASAPAKAPVAKRGKKPATACPASEAPDGEVAAWSERWGIPREHAEFPAFLDHHRQKGNTWADWAAAWRTWLRNGQKFAARAPPSGTFPRQTLLQPVPETGRMWKVGE